MLAKDTLQKSDAPLTVEEIWEKSHTYGLQDRLNSSGKTPWRTLGAQLYVEIRDNPDSDFIQVSKRPVRFALKQHPTSVITNNSEERNDVDQTENYQVKKVKSNYDNVLSPEDMQDYVINHKII